jgi:hypothetical protein
MIVTINTTVMELKIVICNNDNEINDPHDDQNSSNISVSGIIGNKRSPLSLIDSKLEPLRLSGLRLFPLILLTLTN